jgi:hypothetical protein
VGKKIAGQYKRTGYCRANNFQLAAKTPANRCRNYSYT